MFRFLQFRADKKESWKKYTEDQLSKPETLEGTPSFQTVLMVDSDPEELIEQDINPLEKVKYIGPMYWDLDDAENLGKVIEDANKIINYLKNKLDVPERFINCWLSGGKGVHITIAGEIFGLKEPTKFLPLVYKEIMLSVKKGSDIEGKSTIDEGVYSCNRGRMWRCEGIPRPGKGTYKVATSPYELSTMDAEQYQVLVAAPRSPLVEQDVADVTVMKCVELFKMAKRSAAKKVRAMLDATTVPREVFRMQEGTPGCVQRLVTDGDSGESNWNQAALQLASYIAARYDKSEDEEYRPLIHDFVKNVQSSSRPTEKERLKHVNEQLNRTFRGQFKFSPGAFIAVIGTPCRNCIVCRKDIAEGDSSPEEAGEVRVHPQTKILWDQNGYWQLTDNGRRQLTTFTFVAHTEMLDERGHRLELIGDIIDDAGVKMAETISESAWGSRREFLSAVKGRGESQVYCGDPDLQRLLKAVVFFSRAQHPDKELTKMTRSIACGLMIESRGGKLIPHYIESGAAITPHGLSPFSYDGESSTAPRLLDAGGPKVKDDKLAETVRALCGINSPVEMAMLLGWFVSCYFAEHIRYDEPQFSLCNINGNAGAGKTTTAVLLCNLHGIDYTRSPFMNVETGTLWPLMRYLTNSRTVPRLVEEFNPVQAGNNYPKVVGYFKAAFNQGPVGRGQLKDRTMSTNEDRLTAPIIYTSEQAPQSPALRERTIEVTLKAKSRQNATYTSNYRIAHAGRHSLWRLGRALLNVAMNNSPTQVMEVFKSKAKIIQRGVTDRPKWGYQQVLTGLHYLLETLEEYKIDAYAEVKALENELVTYLAGAGATQEVRQRGGSEVAKVIEVFNTLADEHGIDDHLRIKPGKQYVRQGDRLGFMLSSCFPAFLKYTNSINQRSPIYSVNQMSSLLEGETYHLGTETNSETRRTTYFVSAKALEALGVDTSNFKETVPDED